MGLSSDDDNDEEEEDDDDSDEKHESDSDMDEEETIQTNVDDFDTFRLPSAEESEKEGESVVKIWQQIIRKCSANGQTFISHLCFQVPCLWTWRESIRE